jgi:murein DD-endopeptidase MepM/ murein hydrolase activator NlpD
LFVGPVLAQEGGPDGPVYVVQEGDTLSNIALRFGVTVDDLVAANGLSDPNQLSVGTQLIIPGLEGISGVLMTETLPFGESLRSIARRNQIPYDDLVRLNRLVSPAELYVGAAVVLPVDESQSYPTGRVSLAPGDSLLELAVRENTNPWTLRGLNGFSGRLIPLPGDILLTNSNVNDGPGALPPVVKKVEVLPFPLLQGQAARIRISATNEIRFSGSFVVKDGRNDTAIARNLNFFHAGRGDFFALQGVHAMAQPGLYPLTISGELENGGQFNFTQFVAVQEAGYGSDLPLQVDPKTLDPEVTRPENTLWSTLTFPANPEKYWEGVFQSPSPFADCRTSLFGRRRSYNGSPYDYYHTGVDFCGGVGIEIRAPAAGVVVFADQLTVRGNATVIDHGWGVYTGYMHQSEIMVAEGDLVEQGQLIGLVGGTGRVQGPHLHWELIVGGVPINPLDWLVGSFP